MAASWYRSSAGRGERRDRSILPAIGRKLRVVIGSEDALGDQARISSIAPRARATPTTNAPRSAAPAPTRRRDVGLGRTRPMIGALNPLWFVANAMPRR